MSDQDLREKIIRGLECNLNFAEHSQCEECDYECRKVAFLSVPVNLLHDALALLKAQEAVAPVVDIDTWKCGNCGHTLEHQELLGDNVLYHEQYNYCPKCGQAVKWE